MAHKNRTFLVYISETRSFPDLKLGTLSHLNVIDQVAKKLTQSEMVRLASGTTLIQIHVHIHYINGKDGLQYVVLSRSISCWLLLLMQRVMS